jgi:excisionase family DNA binding protein
MSEDLLNVSDAARLIGISSAGVRALADRGQLPVWRRTVGGMRLFVRRDVESLMKQRAERRTRRAERAAALVG